MNDLEAIKARLSAATPGPWDLWVGQPTVIADVKLNTPRSVCAHEVCDLGVCRANGLDPDPQETDCGCEEGRCRTCYPRVYADADLIAHAPEDLAALVEEVERLRAELGDAYNMASGLIDDLNRLRERADGLEHKLRMMHRWNPYTTDSDTLRNLGVDPDAPCLCDRCAEVTRG